MKIIKRVTIKDVAREAGTSISAVSYVLNGSTKKKYSENTVKLIKDAAKKLNYVPNNIARGMRVQKSYSIGIVNFWDIHNHVFVKNLKGIVETANKYKYSVVICPVSNKNVNDYSYIDYYKNRRIDGIVFIAPVKSEYVINEEEHIKRMEAAGVPYVIINTSLDSDKPCYFKYDFFDATYTAAVYLIQRGYKDITYVTPKISEDYPENYERMTGYKIAMEKFGLNFRMIDINDIDKEIMEGFSAVVANKSDTAKKIMDKAIEYGFKIPDDFSIVAANIENYSQFLHVPLTCSQIPIFKIAQRATDILINIINDKTTDDFEKIKCEIVEGKSVK
ncbi:MAG: LacI family DNA-binding transcriptional regulator [Clostridia bacterium]|nr:LacI family DNA-binding transcriptional regulator [Clostridia bacterium]